MADSINGKWKGVLVEMDGMELTFTFEAEGETLSGSVTSDMGDMPISNGKIMEDSFTFEIDAGGQLIDHTCTYSEGKIIMEVPMMENPLTLTRISD
ncbi:hypothetical protein ACFL6P_01885 [Candidatus Latescibacterota bacterium]